MKTFKEVLVEGTVKRVDEVGKFWVVTKPTKDSEVGDIMFQRDVAGMRLQYLGGLKEDEILGIYKKEKAARKHAERLLAGIK